MSHAFECSSSLRSDTNRSMAQQSNDDKPSFLKRKLFLSLETFGHSSIVPFSLMNHHFVEIEGIVALGQAVDNGFSGERALKTIIP
jgi:hypothetical protein